MNTQYIQQSYRQSSIEGASPIGLVIALFDRLTADLRRAVEALRKDDIEARCAELHHAALVLGQLEDWLDHKNGEELSKSLSTFYGYLRAKMLQASIQKSVPLLEEQIALILQIRAAWQQREAQAAAKAAEAESQSKLEEIPASLADREHVAFSQSA
jgi:flagellar protein FliS